MSCTEAEAKTKWCPFARVVPAKNAYAKEKSVGLSSDMPVYNRILLEGSKVPFLSDGAKCLGAECMAWQWSSPRQAPAGTEISDMGFCGMVGTRGY